MASLVTASTRTVYTATICGVTRKFFTIGAAYYAAAKSLIGRKYLGAITLDNAGSATDADRVRADRARALFFDGEAFDSKRWTAYVRRVARKLRALDEHRAKVAPRDGRCGVCGGSEFSDGTDNRGEAYRGCARCLVGAPRG